jgi:hypothetical protein
MSELYERFGWALVPETGRCIAREVAEMRLCCPVSPFKGAITAFHYDLNQYLTNNDDSSFVPTASNVHIAPDHSPRF